MSFRIAQILLTKFFIVDRVAVVTHLIQLLLIAVSVVLEYCVIKPLLVNSVTTYVLIVLFL